MKFIYLLSGYIICTILITDTISAQCIADAGLSKTWCRTVVVPRDTLELGGNYDTISDPTQYSFTWYIKPITWAGGLTFYASTFLNDTTIPNPTLIDGTGDSIKFYLRVDKNNGQSCIDSTTIQMALFVHKIENYFYNISFGDSVKLQPSIIVNESSQAYPDSVRWLPNKYLNDNRDTRPICTPDSSIQYKCYAWFKGCLDSTSYFQFVNVSPLHYDPISIKRSTITIYPNPVQTKSSIRIQQDKFNYDQLIIYDLVGREVMHLKLSNSEHVIQNKLPNPGNYIFKFQDSSGRYQSQNFSIIYYNH